MFDVDFKFVVANITRRYELYPCPFCGSKPTMFERGSYTNFIPDWLNEIVIRCEKCRYELKSQQGIASVVKHWNWRKQ